MALFISYLWPYGPRDIEAPHLWVFYKQLSDLDGAEIVFIGTGEYFRDPAYYVGQNRWEVQEDALRHLEYSLPSAQDIGSARRIQLPSGLFERLDARFGSREQAAKALLTQRFEELEVELDKAFTEIGRTAKPEAVLTWCNSPSLNQVAAAHGLRVIHNELGPLRRPYFSNTAYFDFSGVNGNTEAERRFLRFKSGLRDEGLALSKRELLELLLEAPYAHLAASAKQPSYEIGLPLQIEDDSNILAFSNGFDSRRLIDKARGLFKGSEVLVRRHPGGLRDYKDEAAVMDGSPNSMEFVLSCRRIATINSSVGWESLLFDRETAIFGDSPAAFLAHRGLGPENEGKRIEDEILGLNFLIFGYLMPYEFLFDADYYRWRLSSPSERAIFDLHRACHVNRKKDVRWSSLEVPRTDAGILTLKSAIKQRERRISELTRTVGEKDQRIDGLSAERDRIIAEKDRYIAEQARAIAEKEALIQELVNSRSWRMTAPIRELFKLLRG
ncbi:MAG: hypothetical protein WC728_11585 [Elusimicrobiota bacterium]